MISANNTAAHGAKSSSDNTTRLTKNSVTPSVMHLVLSLDCGGLEHVVLLLCRRSITIGQRVCVVCLEKKGGLASQLEKEGIEIFCLHKKEGIDWSLRNRLAKVFRQWTPEIIHTHQIGALFYAGPAAARGKTPVVHSEHGKHYQKSPKLRLLARYSAWKCHRFVGVASEVCDHAVLHGVVPQSKTCVIPNGIDIDRFSLATGGPVVRAELGIPPEEKVIGSVGRLAKVKNYSLLIQAFAIIRKQSIKAHLLFVGDGPEKAKLQELAEKLGLTDTVHFAGFRDNREDFFNAMDIFSLTSTSEGLPLSMLEAMASGTPVVGSNVGGIPGVLKSEHNGLLFPSGEAAAAAKNISHLLLNPADAQQLALVAQEDVRNHSYDAMAATYLKLYQEVLGSR